MAKLIKINANGTQEEYAGKTTSAGAGDAGEFPVLNGSGKLDTSMLPNGIGADSVTLVAGEALSAGDFIYINGTGQAMKADATSAAKAARGYTLSAASSGANVTVYFDESNSALTSLTPGATYYLSSTAGQVTTTAPTTTGNIVQEVGFATSANNLHVNIQEPITRV